MNREVESLEHLLRAGRPAPSALFVHTLERRLVSRVAPEPHRRLRLLNAALGVATGLATLAVLAERCRPPSV